MKRVVILGRGASGKSTLAKRLSEITALPLIELDKLFWQSDLNPTPRDQWIALQENLVAENKWILDGDLGPYDAVEVRIRAADTIIFLDFSLLRWPGAPSADPASAPTSGIGSELPLTKPSDSHGGNRQPRALRRPPDIPQPRRTQPVRRRPNSHVTVSRCP